MRGQAGGQPAHLRTAAALAAGLVAISLCLSLAYWPGMMTYDSIRQYGQALSGRFDDWHPPLMNWIWRQFLPLAHGPGPMLLLQLLVYAAGYALLAGWALRQRRPRLAVALAAASLMPILVPLMATIVKDSLMAALLLAGVGLLAVKREGRDWPLAWLSAALIALACALRLNAFPAGAPFLVALLPQRLRDTPLKMTAAGLAAMALLLLPLPVANHLLRAEKSGIGVALVIYDLGGITEHTGRSAFPPLPVKDPVANNDICYTPVRWDPYADWGDPDCKVGWAAQRAAFQTLHINPYLFWAKAIVAHPVAYAEHRLQHYNRNTAFLVKADTAPDDPDDEVDRPVHDRSVANDWNIQVTPNPTLKAVDTAAMLAAAAPLGWPAFWMALALGLAFLAPHLPSRRLILPLALSSLLYGLSYAPLSVSSELRYHLWTMVAALLAAVIAGAELPRAGLKRKQLIVAAAPAAVVAIFGAAWRLWPG